MTRNQPGGSARNLFAQMEWEQSNGCQVHIAVGGTDQGSTLPEGVTVHRISTLVREPSPLRDVVAGLSLRRLVRKLGPDVVHTHQSKAGILGRVAARGSHAVIVHTIHMRSFGVGYSPALSLAFRWAERYCASFTDFLVTVGDDLKQQYLENEIGSADQYTVVRSPAGVEKFLPMRDLRDNDREPIRARLGLPTTSRVLIAAGLLEKRKRFDLAIARLGTLLTRDDAVLIIAGDGPERRGLELAAERFGISDRVRCIGYKSNLEEYFAASDLLVQTSYAEGVPQVVVQALAAGLPVVATEVDGLIELQTGSMMIVDRSGTGLGEACSKMLSTPRPEPVAIEVLTPWTESSVRTERAAFHRRLLSAVLSRRVKRTP